LKLNYTRNILYPTQLRRNGSYFTIISTESIRKVLYLVKKIFMIKEQSGVALSTLKIRRVKCCFLQS
jgi:hypothetical protein